MASGPKPGDYYLGFSGQGGEAAQPPPDVMPAWSGTGASMNTTSYSRYRNGDQFKPQQYSSNEVALLQQRLANAGFAPKGGFRAGIWDTDSANAYADALGAANQSGQTFDQLLASQSSPESQKQRGESGQKAPASGRIVEQPDEVIGGHTIKVQNAMDIAKGASDTFTKILGRNIRADESLQIIQQIQNIDRLNGTVAANQEDRLKQAAWLQGMQKAQQAAALYNQGSANPDVMGQPSIPEGVHMVGGNMTQLPNAEVQDQASPEAYSEWVIKTQMPNEYLGSQMGQRALQMGDFLAKGTADAAANAPLTKHIPSKQFA